MAGIDFKEIGMKIRNLRVESKLTQENLAESVDVNISHISNIETGKVKVSLSLLVRICRALNTTVDYVLANEYPHATTPLEREHMISIKKLPPEKHEQLLKISNVF